MFYPVYGLPYTLEYFLLFGLPHTIYDILIFGIQGSRYVSQAFTGRGGKGTRTTDLTGIRRAL